MLSIGGKIKKEKCYYEKSVISKSFMGFNFFFSANSKKVCNLGLLYLAKCLPSKSFTQCGNTTTLFYKKLEKRLQCVRL